MSAKPWRRTNSSGSLIQAANFGMWQSTNAVNCMHRSAKMIIILFLTCIQEIVAEEESPFSNGFYTRWSCASAPWPSLVLKSMQVGGEK